MISVRIRKENDGRQCLHIVYVVANAFRINGSNCLQKGSVGLQKDVHS